MIANIIAKTVGLGVGAYQLSRAKTLEERAKKLRPQNTDPMEANYAAAIDDLRKGYTTGNAYSDVMRQVRQQQVDAIKEATSAAGGFAPAAIEAVNTLNEGAGNAYGKIFTAGQQDKHFYDSLYDKTVNNIIQRKADLQSNDYANAIAKAMAMRTAGQNNLGAGAASVTADVSTELSSMLYNLMANKKTENSGAAKSAATSGRQPTRVRDNGTPASDLKYDPITGTYS